jgi:hypothetical protein
MCCIYDRFYVGGFLCCSSPHIVIEETDLGSLASHRAAKVRDALLKAGIESERVFIVEPKSLAPEKKENLKDSRINFKIR